MYLFDKKATIMGYHFQNMPPQVDPIPSGVVFESDTQTDDLGLDKDVSVLKKATPKKHELVWFNIIWFLFLHISSLYGLYLVFTSAKWQTNVFGKKLHSTKYANHPHLFTLYQFTFFLSNHIYSIKLGTLKV